MSVWELASIFCHKDTTAQRIQRKRLVTSCLRGKVYKTAASSIRNIDIKRGSFVQLTGCRDDAIVVLHDFLYNRQPDPRAAIYFFAMKFLENAENTFTEMGFEADAIVLDRDVAINFSGGKLLVD